MPRVTFFGLIVLFLSRSFAFASQTSQPTTAPIYHIYGGNTHSHTSFTWSHGDQWQKPRAGKKKTPGVAVDRNGAQHPPADRVLRHDWQKHQGPPAAHYAFAKASGYDFYVTTDHSQEAAFQPPSPDNPQWLAAKEQAAEATDADFVALAGYEHSENNGPGGKGHINVINSDGYLNAMAPGIDLPHLYHWLETAKANGDGPVVASFNHPGLHQYDDWANRNPRITDIITMLEVINSNDKIHYAGFIRALDKGWKVSPVCGNDNHGLWGITHQRSRTFVLATAKTKLAILDAMKHRRTYASLDRNLQCRYTVNSAIMGSTLDRPDEFHFDITISDPDTDRLADRITQIDIVKDHGVVARTHTPAPGYLIHWTPTIEDSKSRYFFIRVWTAGGGDAPHPNPRQPVAWLAPVWTGR